VIPFFVMVVVTFSAPLDVSLVVFVVHGMLRRRLPPPTFVPLRLGSGKAPSVAASAGVAIRARGRVVAHGPWTPLVAGGAFEDAPATVIRAGDELSGLVDAVIPNAERVAIAKL
jgi:hypothetical protein